MRQNGTELGVDFAGAAVFEGRELGRVGEGGEKEAAVQVSCE
jgi:hypothetical protein